MAVHLLGPRRGLRRPLLIAYVLWPVPVLTSRRFDAARWGTLRGYVWGWMRSHRLIRMRYYGRGE